MEQDYDFRDQEPLWVKYAEYVGNGSDKFYEVRIDLADDGQFVLTKRWGARPDVGRGQIKPEYYITLVHAQNNADAALGGKLRKGYVLAPRPYAASNKVYKETGPDYYSDEEAF
jgi:predicted DNA-binding WGR domain protein